MTRNQTLETVSKNDKNLKTNLSTSTFRRRRKKNLLLIKINLYIVKILHVLNK